jgi:hypothetical protein
MRTCSLEQVLRLSNWTKMWWNPTTAKRQLHA